MFLPLFIAILLGLASPAQQNCANANTTVQVNNADPGTPGDPGEGGDTGEDGDGGGGGHNGDNGQIPPPRPKP